MSRRSTIISSTYGVGGVVPTWQLLRTATDWQKCGAQPFEVPPTSAWPNIVAALRYVGAYVDAAHRAGRGRCRSIATQR